MTGSGVVVGASVYKIIIFINKNMFSNLFKMQLLFRAKWFLLFISLAAMPLASKGFELVKIWRGRTIA